MKKLILPILISLSTLWTIKAQYLEQQEKVQTYIYNILNINKKSKTKTSWFIYHEPPPSTYGLWRAYIEPNNSLNIGPVGQIQVSTDLFNVVRWGIQYQWKIQWIEWIKQINIKASYSPLHSRWIYHHGELTITCKINDKLSGRTFLIIDKNENNIYNEVWFKWIITKWLECSIIWEKAQSYNGITQYSDIRIILKKIF